MTSPRLEIQNLSVTHNGVTAVSGASLSAKAGNITVLLGANGAGKSSLLRALIGLAASTGAIHLDGQDISGQSTEDRIRNGIAWVPEGRRVFPGMTVAENLLVAGPERPALRAARMEEVFDLFPQLAARPTDRAWQLSGGQQQMLAIGRALMAKPKLYLLDEPSLGLAPRITGAVADSLRALAAGDSAVLVAEQNVGFVEPLADRTLLLRNGEIVSADRRAASS